MRKLLATMALLGLLVGCPGQDDPGPDTQIALEGIPCEVSDVIGRRCIRCHAEDPMFGAPMSLTSAADFAEPSRTPGESVAVRALDRISAEDDYRMPPASQDPLSAEDMAALEGWLRAGAPEMEDLSCTDEPPEPPCMDPSCLPCEPSHTMLVHGDASDEPFHVPVGGNPYRCVAFPSPFGPDTHATAWAPIIDDDRVLHHWILYRTATPQEPGEHDCNMPLDAVGVMGWAPGTQASVLPDDVGLELAQDEGEWLILQMHYYNVAGYEDAFDRSGVAMCTSPRREKTAGVLTLGSTAISLPPRIDTTVTGLCPSTATLLLSEPLHVLANTPHMHEMGTRIKSEILRNGLEVRTPTLVDVNPWSFDDQRTHWRDEPITINPGDAIRTRCEYANPNDDFVFFGERTEDEMCFNFALVYPLEAFPAGFARTCLTTLGL